MTLPTTPSTSVPSRAPAASNLSRIVFVVAFLGALWGFARGAADIRAEATAIHGSLDGVSPRVIRTDTELGQLRKEPPGCIILIGSSQLASSPSPISGGQRVSDSAQTTADILQHALGPRDECVVRISQPILLPEEMLVLFAALVHYGANPRAAAFAVNWDSVAYEEAMRPEIRALLRDSSFAEKLFADLAKAGASAELVQHFRRASEQATPSATDAPTNAGSWVDVRLVDVVRKRSPLLGDVELQAGINRRFVQPILGLMTHGGTTNVHEVLAQNLLLNEQIYDAIGKYARSKQVPALLFLVPQRPNFAPLTKRDGEAAFALRIGATAQANGVAMLDVRTAVPAEAWGFTGVDPDRTHVTLAGHAIVGEALAKSLTPLLGAGVRP
jgi:hypothetical protein